MNKRSKVIIIIVGGLVVIALALYLFVYVSVDGLQDSTQKESEVVFADLKDTVHVIASQWGLTGDHIEIVLSNSPIAGRVSNKSSDYIFYEPTIFHKQENDTLFVYSLSLANVPGNFNTRIKIKQVKIEDTEEMKKYETTYGKLGLTKVSIYDN